MLVRCAAAGNHVPRAEMATAHAVSNRHTSGSSCAFPCGKAISAVMASRLGIELSPAACRIVEVDGGRPWRRSRGDVRVRSFAVLPPLGPELRAKLESLRRRPAAVVVWGGRSEHRQVMVTDGSYEAMRTEALASLSAAGLQTSRVWADIAPAPGSEVRGARRPVVVSMASAAEMSAAVRPLRDAGIWLRTVTTPAVALGSLARQRIDFAPPDAIEAYVALDQQVTCIALVRHGVLLAARELPWGYTDPNYTYSEPRTFEEITTQLADAISDFVGANGGSARDLGQVCLCGGLPELRTMSTALMQRLDVEVEPLDSLFGIDASRLPAPADEFRERGAELRLAWAAATDWPPPINLLRSRRRQVSTAWFARAAVVAGAAAGLAGSWWAVERRHVLPAVTRVASSTARGRNAARVKPVPPPVVASKVPAVVPPPVVAVNKAPMVTSPVAAPPVIAANKPPVVVPPPLVANNAPPPPVVKPVVLPPPAAVAMRLEVAPMRTERAPARVKPAPPAEEPLPFDATLGTILFSPDRRLAIIDDRIVGIGDEVRGARVIEITSGAVTLRDGQGRLRRLALGAFGAGVIR